MGVAGNAEASIYIISHPRYLIIRKWTCVINEVRASVCYHINMSPDNAKGTYQTQDL
jgi:hypothetical protein